MSLSEQASPPAKVHGTGRIFFGWYIVAAAALFMALGYSARYSFSVFFPILIDEFQWPRDLGASILSIHMLFYGLTAPVAGHLVDRFGARRTMFTGILLLTLGMILSRWGYKPWHFYLTFGVIAGIGLCLLGSVPLIAIIRNWFEQGRAKALSVLFFGMGMAYACYPAAAWLIERLDWRNAYAAEGLILAAVVIPIIALVMVYHPRQKGLERDGRIDDGRATAIRALEKRRVVDKDWVAVEWTLKKAARTSRFWLLCLTTFTLWGIGHNILVTHQIAFAMDIGYSHLYASAVLSLGGLSFSLGALASMISDRIGREEATTIGLAISLSSIVVLLLIRDTAHPWMLYYYAVSFGFGFGMCAPLVTTIVTDIFQGPKVGSTVGFVWFSFAIGGTIGPWFGGWLFELAGDYIVAFIIAGLMFFVAGAAVWLAAPRKVRLVPGRVKD